LKYSLIVFAQVPYFLHYDIFHFTSSNLLKQADVSLPFLPCNVSHSKQVAIILTSAYTFTWNCTICSHSSFYFPAFFSLPFNEVSKFLDPILYALLYLKPLLPINKQHSIDSCLGWQGHHWDFCSSRSSLSLLILFRLRSHISDAPYSLIAYKRTNHQHKILVLQKFEPALLPHCTLLHLNEICICICLLLTVCQSILVNILEVVCQGLHLFIPTGIAYRGEAIWASKNKTNKILTVYLKPRWIFKH